MPGKNRRESGGAGANAGRRSGMCRQSGEAASSGQGMSRKGGAVQGGCRRQQDGGLRRGRGGGPRIAPDGAGGKAGVSPVGHVDATGGIVQVADPNQQALDEIMESVRQMETHAKGKI